MNSTQERFRTTAEGRLRVGSTVALQLGYAAGGQGFRQGGQLWIFYDIRQYTTRQQRYLPAGITITGPAGTSWTGTPLADGQQVRTLDTYPQVPEFLYALHVVCTGGTLAPGEQISIDLKTNPDGFRLPENAIDEFHFWLVEDPAGALTFEHAPGEKYHYFHPREAHLSILQGNPLAIESGPASTLRVVVPSLSTGSVKAQIHAEDDYGNPVHDASGPLAVASSVKQTTVDTEKALTSGADVAVGGTFDTVVATLGTLTGGSNPVRIDPAPAQPQLFWGELHGMAFNQRPYRDYFAWAKDVASLDFAAGQLFSYNTCVEEVWDTLKQVWQAYDLPGIFVSLPAVEFGTLPDVSHRIALFPSTADLPPIFCEERKAAHDPQLQARFSPDTVYCGDYRELYKVARRFGALLHGHFHTQFYEGEDLAEIYQKQPFDIEAEEEKINEAIRGGLKLGIVAGSDTHDSRPTNPHPEPGPVRPAGITGVWADRLDRRTLFEALRHRRCFATTGPRILLDFRVNDQIMGATVRADRYALRVEALGTAEISRIELVENGEVRRTYTPRQQHATVFDEWPASDAGLDEVRYCYARVFQADGERAWSSPVWLER